MKIAMVTGSYPPDACGVGDYTCRLVKELKLCGVTVEVVTHDDWHLKNIIPIVQKINSIKPDIIHIQYPTVGYGGGLAPQMLSMFFPCVVTLHEVSQAHILRRLSLILFFIRSQNIIFTSSYERDYAARWFPWFTSRCRVIPVGSNIPVGSLAKKRDSEDILYFGLIRPHKGLEEVLQFASLVKQASLPLSIRIAGNLHPRYRRYFETLREQSKLLPIQWSIGLSENAVADLMSRSRIAYMPFPDGASERRTSLLALLASGVVTVTTLGKATPPELKDVLNFAQSPESALLLIRDILADRSYQAQLSKKGRAYANNFTWNTIAKKNFEVYNMLFSPGKQ
jgi:glycosyltransferase involved in cell wall biosynthesis